MRSPRPDAPAVEADALTKIYGSGNTEVVAMREASLTIARGEVAALLGPSGAGKTTLLTVVGLVTPPTEGQLSIAGVPVLEGPYPLTNLRTFRRQRLGFVFQQSNLIPFLTACENVQVAMELDGWPRRAARRRALELLDYLDVANRADFYPTTLSGGQQQRVAVARALANEPAVVLADEPTAALDSHRGRQVMGLFRKVAHDNGTGVLVVTHDHRALDVFDTLYEMEDGVVRMTEGSPATSMTH
ncbi:MAG: ABC transporter ATP-binding protein [Planctomycetes bacterium]|nr:ABC transporter ATP-binding protein [Planctomycetota bacterium]